MTVRFRRRTAYLCAGMVVLAVVPVFGAATLVNDDRFIELSADALDSSGNPVGTNMDVTPDPPGSFFSEERQYDLVTPSGDSWARSFTQQISALAGGTTFSSATASGLVEAQGGMEGNGVSSMAFAESRFQLDFNIATPHNYTFDGLLDARSSGTTIRAVLKQFEGADVFRTTTEGVFTKSGLLPAGDYTVEIVARVFKFGSFYNSDASFSNVVLDLTAVPEPGALSLLVFGGAFMLRRGRTR